MYRLFLRPLLFLLPPETAHKVIFSFLRILRKIPLGRALMRLFYKKEYKSLSREVFGLQFPNPVGLAGGLDKNGECYNELSDFGFGFVEIGSLTPLPQEGNPRPRLFRLKRDRALINRMGINNQGVRKAVENLRRNRPEVLVAANIAKNARTSNEDAARDYETAFSLMYDFVDLFVVNVSCPNVVGVDALQDVSFLSDIMDKLLSIRRYYDEYRPLLVKLSPDIPEVQLDEILDWCQRSGIDGVVIGNTTRHREGLVTPERTLKRIGDGGLSGAPLFERSLARVQYIHEKTRGRLPIIGAGGISSPAQAEKMLRAGASLVEIYTGFIYEGPGLVGRIKKQLAKNGL